MPDIRIVMENSLAMDAADPDNLRGAAVELAVRRLGETTRAGFWSYDEHTAQVVAHGAVDAMWKQVASIHARNLAPNRSQSDLPGALAHATWDIDQVDRGTTHLLLLSTGRIATGVTQAEHDMLRQRLLADWAAKLRRSRIVVHTVAFGTGADQDLLRQLAQISGGLYTVAEDRAALQAFVLDVLSLPQSELRAIVDTAGRFQVAPGSQVLNLLWLTSTPDAPMDPHLITPDGQTLTRASALASGRWLLAQDFEMLRIDRPQPGWWQLRGVPADRVDIIGEVEIRVSGLDGALIPNEDSHGFIQLFSQGEPIQDEGFLSLIDVRAWLHMDDDRLPLPVEKQSGGYGAYFVNLKDGHHRLEVQVAAPTFRHQLEVPFVVANPLRVEIKQASGTPAQAWLQFNHAEVDYATVKAAAKVRVPPGTAKLSPAQKHPGGLWQIPLNANLGVVELSFSVAGNLLNKKGFIIRTKPQTVQLPLADGALVMRFDSNGKVLRDLSAEIAMSEAAHEAATPATSTDSGAGPEVIASVQPTAPEPPPAVLIPLWFVGVISVVNLALGAVLWWLFKPTPLPFAPGQMTSEAA